MMYSFFEVRSKTCSVACASDEPFCRFNEVDKQAVWRVMFRSPVRPRRAALLRERRARCARAGRCGPCLPANNDPHRPGARYRSPLSADDVEALALRVEEDVVGV